jgi:two-component system cell cycle sensor histidine kinase/response regulator CckA
MDTEAFSQQLTAFYDQLRTLSQTLELPLDKLMEDLATALEELRVADETLRQQHQALAEAHYTIATERQRYHDLFAYAPDGYLVTNEAGVITDANRAAAVLLTVRQDRLIGKPLAAFVSNDGRPALWTCLAAAIRAPHSPQHVELMLQPRHGAPLYADVSVAALTDPQGTLQGLQWMIRDMTERHRIEALLARYHLLSEHARDIVLFIRLDGQIVEANQAAVDAYGYDRAGRALWQHFLATGTQQGEYTLQRQDGTSVEVEYRATAHIVPGLHLTVLRDISWRKRAERALQQANAALEQRVQERTAALAAANEALRQEMAERQHAEEERRRLEREAQRVQHFALLGRLAAGVSHEIRNPLAAVFLHVDLLEEEFRQPSSDSAVQIAESLTDIKRNLVRLEDLVQDYLSLVRVTTMQRAPEDLEALVLTFAREMDAALATRSITLQLDGLAHLGTVPLHANTFQRALLNLVHNAMDAMPQGGTLRLRGRREATQVHLDVCDTGTGIPPEQCLQIFEPLYTTKPGGTGLGLYIVQEIVAAHGGRIAVQSTLGHGTTFTITLPVEPPLQADAPG